MSDKQPGKWQWKLNLFIGLLLVLALYVAVNGIAFKHYYRQNVLLASSYTKIGGQTVNLLKSLPEPLTIVNYVSANNDAVTQLIANDVDTLLDEYAYHGREGAVSVSRVDPYLNFDAARKLAEEYKLTTQENVLIISCKGRRRILSYGDLADVDTSQVGVGGAPRLESFKAEEMISSAIQSLVQGKRSKIYFLAGHGEYDPDTADRDNLGYSILKSYLERQNSDVLKLNLAELPKVPEDADLIVSACPKSRYSSYEIDVLKNYLRHGGGDNKGARLALMLDPGTVSGLEDFAADYGVTFQNDMVMGKFALVGRAQIVANAVVTIYPNHPAVEWLRKSGVALELGPMRSLAIVSGTAKEPPAAVTALAQTPNLFWGETDYQSPDIEFDAARDFAGPLTVAAAVDTASIGDGQVQLKGVKIALIGGGYFLINQKIDAKSVDFFINLANWMLEGGRPLGIAPKTPKQFTVALTSKQIASLTTFLLMFPLAGLTMAVMVWLKRRR
ncbi:MAG: GldG family protein [Verrucomicrobiales bacterium]|jgi:hypothetical protein|nr:GldG family protein [Verrucomicrobiales bacterium]